ncbi:MAG TPA: hypothetical protein VIO84_12945 [Candidatus Dormibacteraeota bacterium]
MRSARAALLAAVLAAALLPVAPALAASPPDLATLLADPPSSGFSAVPNGGSGNFGPQDATLIASSASNPTAAKQRLAKDEFTRGYEKGWVQQTTGLVLVEGAYEFKSDTGARDYFAASKTGDAANKDFQGFFDPGGLNPAYGAHFRTTDGFPSDAVVFVKGNLDLVVVMGNRNGVDNAAVLSQAMAQYSRAPAHTLPQATASTGLGSFHPGVSPLALGLFTGLVLVVALIIGLVALFTRRRAVHGGAAAAVPTLTLSGDGRHWWDGSSWHDTESSAPPGAQRSPDGAYWYDGTSWRLVPGGPSPRPLG